MNKKKLDIFNELDIINKQPLDKILELYKDNDNKIGYDDILLFILLL